jgi:hypothetical protein
MDKDSAKGDSGHHSAMLKEGIFIKGTIVERTRRLQMFSTKFLDGVIPEDARLTPDNHMFIITYFVNVGINKELLRISDTGNGSEDLSKTALEKTDHSQIIPIDVKSYVDKKGVVRVEYSRVHDASSQLRLRKNEEIF